MAYDNSCLMVQLVTNATEVNPTLASERGTVAVIGASNRTNAARNAARLRRE